MANIYESIAAIIADCPAIAKNSRNTQGNGYMYRGIDAVMNVFQPLLAKHKVFVVPEIIDATREERQTKNGGNLLFSILTIRYTFYAEDGSYVQAVVQGEGMDSGDKASNKAMSVAFKYAMFQVFCIPTEEMRDPDAETPEPSVPKTIEEKKWICSECGCEIEPMIDAKGRSWTPQALFERSIKMSNDGKPRCVKCFKKYEKRLKETSSEKTDNIGAIE